MREAQPRTVYLKDYRVPDFLIDETHLKFELYEDHALVSSRLVMRRNPDAEDRQAPLALDGRELELRQAALDGNELTPEQYQLDEEKLVVPDVPDSFVFSCRTRIRPQENTSLEGLYKSRRMFCTQCEAEGFRKITYYLDRPDVMSVFTTTVEADKDKYPVLLSNGNNTAAGVCEHDAGRHWVTWHDPFRKPSYLFALVAGDLQSVDDTFTTVSGKEVELRIFVEEKDLDKCDFALASLKKAMRWDEEAYGREYDLDIFMIVAVDDFNMGAMENKGLNIFNASCVLANPATTTDAAFQRIESIVAHEYFHNWSGNRVTCRDWFQLSLKEGFTVFRDSQFSAAMGSPAVKRVQDVKYLRTAQFAEDAGPMAHPVRPESYMEISNFYTLTVYEKGAEVVRMLAELLGPELFRRGTDLYFERLDGMAVTTEDFVSVMEEVSGLDLTQFRNWYTQAGTPELKIGREYNEENRTFRLSVEQSCPPTPGQPEKKPFHIPLKMALLDSRGKELPLRLVEENEAARGERVLAVRENRELFEFADVPENPVPSLLRGFSAPVKLHMETGRDELTFLINHDNDGFVRWEASQQLALRVVDDQLDAYRAGRESQVDQRLVEAYRQLLKEGLDGGADKAMIAHLVQLPSEAYIGEQAQEVDVDGIHHVRSQLRKTLARELRDILGEVYEHYRNEGPYVFNAEAVGRRLLKNTSLAYLLETGSEEQVEHARLQYEGADNMTDTHAVLQALVNCDEAACEPVKQALLDDFYRRWRYEPLVVEQWFSLQAGANIPGNLPKVKELTWHEAFDIKNPNKVRAVIGAFCNLNQAGFHQKSGEGYRFLADHVITLNRLNPQIAARLLTPLTRWKRYDPERQSLMQGELRRILDSGKLSPDVYEVVSKSL